MSQREKIKTIDELARIIRKLKEQGKTVAHCHGVFDLMHPGHIRHFMSAKKEGDVLVVTITEDKYVGKGPGRPVFNQHLRAESIAALECVDYVAINKWQTAVETIKKLKPDIYVKGSDYVLADLDITGAIDDEKRAVESAGGKICFTDDITFSSTAILNKFLDVYPKETQRFLEQFREKFSATQAIESLKALKDLKVLVVGDTIIDEYHYCKAMGKSPKENIISTRYINEERFAGGVLACVNHMAGFCENVHLVTCLGTIKSEKNYIIKNLKTNIKTKFFFRKGARTIIKRRFVDPEFLTKSFEISFINDDYLPDALSKDICRYLEEVAGNYDLVVISDFGHGFIDKNIIDVLCSKARFVAVNTQTNSANTGFNMITKYPRADYICIDEPEIRLATHDKFGEIKSLIFEVSKKLKCRKVTITRGHMGAITYNGKDFFEAPVFSSKIVDRTGAGDAFLSVTSPLVAAGNPMDLVGFVGNAVGAMAVNIVCNRKSIEPVPLYKFITSLLK